jgi:nitrogen fixation/metabolism regulation signal transduction histidine kinase
VSPRTTRVLRYLLLGVGCLGAVGLFMLVAASANDARFAQQLNVLVVLNGVIVVVLVLLVGRECWRLFRNRRKGMFGARLATRLVGFFALMAILPGALLYGVSVAFLGNSIESWFNVKVDRALEAGMQLGRNALDYLLQDLEKKGQQIAVSLSEPDGTAISIRLDRLREQAGVAEAALFDLRGNVMAFSSSTIGSMRPQSVPPPAIRRARTQVSTTSLDSVPEQGLVLRAIVPVNVVDGEDPLRVLQLMQPVPRGMQESTEVVESGYRDYQGRTYSLGALKDLYGVTLTLTLLLALLSALGLAIVLSEKLSRPLGVLAEGTRAVAQGDFSRHHPVQSSDELGVLTDSFNRMTRQLAEGRERDLSYQHQIENTNAFLENLLRNLSAGVLAFDRELRLRSANHSAAVILQQSMVELVDLRLDEWIAREPALTAFTHLIHEGFAGAVAGQWQRQAELIVAGNRRTLLMRGTRIEDADSEGGHVIVFDDISELAQAQRDAAWAEVARRLAHEIKNPLTPIQLSAERLQHKLGAKLAEADSEVLRRGTQTIITQVNAMKHMVDDFAIYARATAPGKMQAVDVHELLHDILGLYEHQRPYIHLDLESRDPLVTGEPTRLRQVVHNLLQNALDAQAEQPDPRIDIRTENRDGSFWLHIADQGTGFPPAMIDRVFEPYVTTKPKGTGLGLAIVKKIIDEHGGKVHIENKAPTGAQVSIALPPIAAAA